MEVTKELLKELYKKYNILYFNDELPLCTLHYSNIDICLGRYTYKKDKDGKIKGHIWITTKVNWSEETIKVVLIHEMIHHYIKTIEKRNFDGLFGHGFFFRRKMNKINKEYGLNVKTYFKEIKIKK
jgi:hypothetical protein